MVSVQSSTEQTANVKGYSRAEILDWARKCRARGSIKAVLMALAMRANRQGSCWPSQSQIADDAGLCERTVRYAICALIAAGVLDTTLRYGPFGRRASLYRLNVGHEPQFRPSGRGKYCRNSTGKECRNEGGDPGGGYRQNMPPVPATFASRTEVVIESQEDSHLEDRSRSTTRVEQVASSVSAAARDSGQPASVGDDALAAQAQRIGISRASLANQVALHSRPTVQAAVARLCGRIDAGEAIRSAGALLPRICEDIRANPPKSRQKPFVPAGAIDLGDGRFLSRYAGIIDTNV